MFGLRTPKKRGEEKATLESPPNTRDKTVRRKYRGVGGSRSVPTGKDPPPEMKDLFRREELQLQTDAPSNEMVENRKILEKIEEQTTLMRETNRNTEEIKKMIELQGEKMRTDTYAGVAAGRQVDPKENRRALHSLIITSENEEHTGEQVLAELRDTIDAKQGMG
ncbi:hypothetical protein ACJJTC_007790 [Scirpophaga incertulas]